MSGFRVCKLTLAVEVEVLGGGCYTAPNPNMRFVSAGRADARWRCAVQFLLASSLRFQNQATVSETANVYVSPIINTINLPLLFTATVRRTKVEHLYPG